MANGSYISIPGIKTHELPPLLVSGNQHQSDGETPNLDLLAPEVEDMLSSVDAEQALMEQRRFDLAVQLDERYEGLSRCWWWGESVLDWIRQCETTFEYEADLRGLIRPDVWPHASRASFVRLLEEKNVPTGGINLEQAVGLRLTFRHLPPVDVFANQFLLFLNATMAETAYNTWSSLTPSPTGLFPPQRFHFDVLELLD